MGDAGHGRHDVHAGDADAGPGRASGPGPRQAPVLPAGLHRPVGAGVEAGDEPGVAPMTLRRSANRRGEIEGGAGSKGKGRD